MANYSFAGLENLWIKNGGNPAWAASMAAVAYAGESGGDPTARNPSGATGIWQILSSAQSAAFNAQHPAASMTDPNANARAAIALLGNGSGISNWQADPIGAAIVASGSKPLTPQQAQQYVTTGAPTSASLTADVTPAATNPNTNPTALASLGASGAEPQVNGGSGSATLPSVTMSPPIAGQDPKNFHGYDLSAIPQNMLGNAERAVQKYITDPGYAAQINQTVAQDFGYSGSWIQKLPQVNGVLIWASADLDPSTAAGQNLFLGAISNTNWWKTTNQNQRAWDEVQSQDPATAHEALQQAQDKVLATANQVGVTLSKTQLDQIANTYAAQSYTPTGVLGSASGTSQEWLDTAVVDTALNVKATGAVVGGAQSTNQDYAGGTTDINANTDPSKLTGIASQLYASFQSIAQNYLMYNSATPEKGLLTQQALMGYVDDALKNFTGSGSFGSSNLINGATQQFTQTMMQQASQMYPSLAGSIQQGVTPTNYVAPITSVIANTLGLNQSAINLTDPQWSWAIATPDAKTGVKTALTPDQVLQKITAPTFTYVGSNGQSQSYADSNNAKQLANNFSQSFASAFGKGA